MPYGDGTGPRKTNGPGFGKRRGSGGANSGVGTGGFCICPHCKTRVPHERGVPCFSVKCPKCGTQMVRE